MKYLKMKVASVLILACLALTMTACDNNTEADSTIVTTRISLDATETTVATQETIAEPEYFEIIPNLQNRVFTVSLFNQESHEVITEYPQKISFMNDNIGLIFDFTKMSRTNFSMNPIIYPDTTDAAETTTEAGTESQDVYTESHEENPEVRQVQFITGDITTDVTLFVTNGVLYMQGDLGSVFYSDEDALNSGEAFSFDEEAGLPVYQLNCQWGVQQPDLESELNRLRDESRLDLSRLYSEYTDANAPKQLLDFMASSMQTPVVIEKVIRIGDMRINHTYKIKDNLTAQITTTVDGNTDTTLINSTGIYTFDDSKKEAYLHRVSLDDIMTTIADLQSVTHLKPSEVVITSDTVQYDGVTFAHVNISNNGDENADYYFDDKTGVIKYVVYAANNSIVEFKSIEPADSLDESLFTVPSDYTVIDKSAVDSAVTGG